MHLKLFRSTTYGNYEPMNVDIKQKHVSLSQGLRSVRSIASCAGAQIWNTSYITFAQICSWVRVANLCQVRMNENAFVQID